MLDLIKETSTCVHQKIESGYVSGRKEVCNPCLLLSPPYGLIYFGCLLYHHQIKYLFVVGMDFPQISYLNVAWNSIVQMRLGCFGLAMVDKKVSRL